MKRWLIGWGPPLFGFALATASGMGLVACIQGLHWMAIVPVSVIGGLAFLGSCYDIISDTGNSGPDVRQKAFSNVCKSCQIKEKSLLRLEAEILENREALVSLRKDGWQ